MSLTFAGGVTAALPTIDLADLSPVVWGDTDDDYNLLSESQVTIAGTTYLKSILFYSPENGYLGYDYSNTITHAEYNLGYKYEKLTATGGMADNQGDANAKGRIKIYGDSVLLYDSSDISLGQKKAISLNVSNVLRLKIEFIAANVSGNPNEGYEYYWNGKLVFGTPSLVIKDTTPPNVSLSAPRVSSNSSTSTTFPVTYSVSDPSPASGVKSWKLQVKTGAGGTWSDWKTGTTGVSSTKKSFIGSKGKTYYFRLIATDNKSNTKTSATVYSIVPYDNVSFSYSSGWGKWSSSLNYGASTRYKATKGAYAKFSFSGSSVYLVSPKSPNLGKANVYIDGIYQNTIDLYASSNRYRQVVFSKSLNSGSHAIKVVVKGQRNANSKSTFVHVDGIAVKK